MSVFCPRNEDPLLQNDPLAPSDETEADEESSEETPSPKGDSLAEEKGAREASSEPASKFASSETGCPTRTITCSTEAANDGRLAPINTALNQGWRLDRVDVLEDGAKIAFLLERKTEAADAPARVV